MGDRYNPAVGVDLGRFGGLVYSAGAVAANFRLRALDSSMPITTVKV
jgi:hypothetical protein